MSTGEEDWKVDCSDDENYGLTYSEMVWHLLETIYSAKSVILVCFYISSSNNGYQTLHQPMNCLKATLKTPLRNAVCLL